LPLQTSPSEHEVPNASGLLKHAPLPQPSVVQGLLSLQVGGVPATQLPLLQLAGLQKSVEQELPLAAAALCAQPTPAWQLSTVHGLPSSQLGGVPALQLPFWQAAGAHGSFEHGVPVATLTNEQPVCASHESAVHGLLSLHTMAPCATHAPVMSHMPLDAQALVGTQELPVRAMCWQPCTASQLSEVQVLLSLQFSAAPGRQLPVALQVSWPLQRSLSSQALPAARLVCEHGSWPTGVEDAQLSFVHGLLSLQLGAMPPTQPPTPLQVSTPLQALPSEHSVPMARLVNTQPLAELQLSAVQALPSLHTRGVPAWQLPLAAQISLPLQASPSEQERPATPVWTHPVAATQLSSVQTLLSLQTTGVAPAHTPPPQTSPLVQAFPSSHATVLFV
jgi:hypothetical protein